MSCVRTSPAASTGSKLLSPSRNVTATYLHLFARGGLLLDCGEGTYGQLRRRYGERADAVVAGLKGVWISHIHADHHAGLARCAELGRRHARACPFPVLTSPVLAAFVHTDDVADVPALYAEGQPFRHSLVVPCL